MPDRRRTLGLYTAVSLVVANMIGTGVFTSLGFQVPGIPSVFSILLLWLIGGVIALTGALSYGELAATMPRSGGEYHYLSKIYHPAVGFLSGWISLMVGFAAPVALASMALGSYLNRSTGLTGVGPQTIAIAVVVAATLIHSFSIRAGSVFQNSATAVKVSLILFLIAAGLMSDHSVTLSVMPSAADAGYILQPAFAISLIYVSYAYSGWNASAYMAGEIESPRRLVPRSLFAGTALVMVLYILLNFVFLYTVPMNELANQLEVGLISAEKIFGSAGGKTMGIIISLLLISSISSMVMIGPRISQVMGEDFKLLKFLSRKNNHGVPVYAMLLQSVITLIYVLSSTFEQVMTYAGFTLQLFTFLTVLGVFVLRIRKPGLPRPYKTWGYPVTPLVFLTVNGWILLYVFREKPYESLAGLATVLAGLLLYFLSPKKAEETMMREPLENPQKAVDQLP